MSLPVRYQPEARAEYDAGVDWYEQQRTGLGVKFIHAVGDVLGRISANPLSHAKFFKDVRRGVVRKFPYVVLYQVEPNEIVIVSVFHTSRDPAEWQSRV